MALQHDSGAPNPRRGSAPSYHAWIVASVALVVGAGAYAYYANALTYRWYASAFLYDFGWFNDLVSGRSLELENAHGVGAFSFYAVHVAPILSGFSALSRLAGLKGAQPVILMLGLGFSAATAMAFVVLERFIRPAGWIVALAGAGVAALCYSVSGVMRATADYPHFEILYVPLALLTLHLLFQRRFPWAWGALALCLAVREDAGLHLACILCAYLVLAAMEERGWPARLRELAPFLAACLVYPVLAILWQRTNWPDMGSTFTAIYIGAPPYRHLTGALIGKRAAMLSSSQGWVTLTLLASVAVAPFQRRWTTLTGLVAAAPWFLLNVTANSEAAGGLMLYYAFPFLVTALAPFVVAAAAPPPPREEEVLDVLPR